MMILLEGKEKAISTDDSLYNEYYILRPIDGVPNGYLIERKYQFTHEGISPSPFINTEKNSYVVMIEEYEELQWILHNLEPIFKFLEHRYKHNNIWFREYTEGGSDSRYYEFEYVGDPKAIIKYMSILLYSNNHIIDLGNGKCKEVFIAPTHRYQFDIDGFLKNESREESN